MQNNGINDYEVVLSAEHIHFCHRVLLALFLRPIEKESQSQQIIFPYLSAHVDEWNILSNVYPEPVCVPAESESPKWVSGACVCITVYSIQSYQWRQKDEFLEVPISFVSEPLCCISITPPKREAPVISGLEWCVSYFFKSLTMWLKWNIKKLNLSSVLLKYFPHNFGQTSGCITGCVFARFWHGHET